MMRTRSVKVTEAGLRVPGFFRIILLQIVLSSESRDCGRRVPRDGRTSLLRRANVQQNVRPSRPFDFEAQP